MILTVKFKNSKINSGIFYSPVYYNDGLLICLAVTV